MKQIILLPTLICTLLFLACSSSDNENDLPALSVSECNQLVYDAYNGFIQAALEYSENPTTSNCNAVKETAQNTKNIAIQCNLWEGDINEEVEDILNLDCN